MTDFYVYEHRRATTGEVFYVGKGRNQRAWATKGRSEYWNQVVNKYGHIVRVVLSGLSEPCAFSMERALIRFHGRENLVNATDGGEGASGLVIEEWHRRVVAEANRKRKISPETRKKLSEAHFGRVRSAETRAKLSSALRGKRKSEEHRAKLSRANMGKTPSPETRAKMTASRMGKPRGPFRRSIKSR